MVWLGDVRFPKVSGQIRFWLVRPRLDVGSAGAFDFWRKGVLSDLSHGRLLVLGEP